MQITVKFTPAPPAAGKNFALLRVTLTPSSGGNIEKDVLASAVSANAVAQPDGTYDLPVEMGNVPVGNYTIIAKALDQYNQLMGTAYSGSGNVSLANGVWFPQAVAFGS